MLPPQLRKAVEAAHQTAQQQIQQRQNEEDGRLSTQEYSRLAELQKQRAHLEMRQLQAEAGLLTKTQAQVAAAGLEWLYDDPKNSAQAKQREQEAFLLGKPLPNTAPKADESLEQRVSESVTKAAAVLLPTQDRLRKLREDPLLLIRQAELAQQQAQDDSFDGIIVDGAAQEANPLLQLQQKQQAQAPPSSAKKVKKESKKNSKKEKKHRKKGKHKHNRGSSSSDDDSKRDRRRDKYRDTSEDRYPCDRARQRSRSRDKGREPSFRHLKQEGHENSRYESRSHTERTYSAERTRGRNDNSRMDVSESNSSHHEKRLAPSSSRAPVTSGSSRRADGDSSAQAPSSEDRGKPRVYGPKFDDAGSTPAPFRVAEELLPPLAIRQKAQALMDAQRAKVTARETVQLQQQATASDTSGSGVTADQKLREMQEEGLRREAEKQRRSQLVQMKEQLEERIEAQRRALLDASEETRGLRPKVLASGSVEPARDVTMKVRKLHRAINDLDVSNKELK